VTAFAASAPGKAILLGEHGVNRHQPALVAAIDRRVYCTVVPRPDGAFVLRSNGQTESIGRAALLTFKREIDAFRESASLDALNARASGFFAPASYVLAHLVERFDVPGLTITWDSQVPCGSGLGSGAAASAAMAHAVIQSAGEEPDPFDVAWLAWQGDVIAHGGIASGLDSGACALGGVTLYTLEAGPTPVPAPALDYLIIAHTGKQANTAMINTGVRQLLREQPHRMHLFREMGLLAEEAQRALADGRRERLGQLMNLSQLVLARLGVSTPEIEALVDTALSAGALGAKLSGSGGGGIIIALPPAHGHHDLVTALKELSAEVAAVSAGVVGVRAEAPETPPQHIR
jgi:mevalonate kinase